MEEALVEKVVRELAGKNTFAVWTIKRVFVLIHIGFWILFSLLIALQLSQNNSNWPTLTAGLILTCLYVFYSHFALLTRYSGKKKKATYYLILAAIILTGPLIYLFFPYRIPDNPNSFFEQYIIYMFSIVLPFIFLSWLAQGHRKSGNQYI